MSRKIDLNNAKRDEMRDTFTALKTKLGSSAAVAEKLGIPASRVQVYIRGESMGTNDLRARAKTLLASLS